MESAIAATGFIVEKNGEFLAGYKVEIGESEFEAVVEDYTFQTREDAEAFLIQNMESFVDEVCKRLGKRSRGRAFSSQKSDKCH